MQSFKDQLIAARKAKGMTQDQLAKAVFVARNTISSWERGRTEPGIDALRNLSKVLDYDFLGEIKAEPSDLDIPDAGPVGTNAGEGAEAAPAATPDVQPPRVHARRGIRRAWIIAGAALLVCAAAAFALVWRAQVVANRFPAETYRQETPNDPDRAFLTFETETWEEQTEDAAYARYSFTLNEQNGKPFNITSVEVRYDNPKGVDRTFLLSADDLRGYDLDPDIPASGSFSMDGGFPKGEFRHVGVTVNGADADGVPNTFHYLIDI